MAPVTTTYRAEDKNVQKLLNDIRKQTERLEDENRRLREETKKTGKAGRDAFGDIGQAIGSAAVKIGSFAGLMEAGRKAIELLRNEWENLLSVQREAANQTVTLAQAQEQALGNLGVGADLTGAQLFDRIRGESRKLGVDERSLTLAVSDALSARGDKTAAEAIKAVTASAELRRFTPEQLPLLSGAALDLQKTFGGTAQEALGFLSGVGQISRVTDFQKLAQNVAPAIIGLQGFGLTKEEGASLTAAITQATADFTGAQGGTAAIALGQQLREFGDQVGTGGVMQTLQALRADPQLQQFFMRGGKSAAQLAGERDIAQLEQQREQITRQLRDEPDKKRADTLRQQRDELGDRIRDRKRELAADPAAFTRAAASFEKRALPAIEKLIAGGNEVTAQQQAGLASLQQLSGEAVFRELVRQRDTLPTAQAAMTQNLLQNAAAQAALASPDAAVSGVIREQMQPLLAQIGEGSLAQRARELISEVETGGMRTIPGVIGELESLERDRRGTQQQRVFTGVGPAVPFAPVVVPKFETVERQPTEGEVEQADILKQLITALQEVVRIQEESVEQQRQNGRRQNAAGARRQGEPVAN